MVETAYLGELVDESYVLNLKMKLKNSRFVKEKQEGTGFRCKGGLVNGYSSENMEDWRKYMDSPWSNTIVC